MRLSRRDFFVFPIRYHVILKIPFSALAVCLASSVSLTHPVFMPNILINQAYAEEESVVDQIISPDSVISLHSDANFSLDQIKKGIINGSLKYSDLKEEHKKAFSKSLTGNGLLHFLKKNIVADDLTDLTERISSDQWKAFKAEKGDYTPYIQYMSRDSVTALHSNDDLTLDQIKVAIVRGKLKYSDLKIDQMKTFSQSLTGQDLIAMSQNNSLYGDIASEISLDVWKAFKSLSGNYSPYVQYMSSGVITGLLQDLTPNDITTALINKNLFYSELDVTQKLLFDTYVKDLKDENLKLLFDNDKLSDFANQLSSKQWKDLNNAGGDYTHYIKYMSYDSIKSFVSELTEHQVAIAILDGNLHYSDLINDEQKRSFIWSMPGGILKNLLSKGKLTSLDDFAKYVSLNQWEDFDKARGDYTPYIKDMLYPVLVKLIPQLKPDQIKIAIVHGNLEYTDLNIDQKTSFSRDLSGLDIKVLSDRNKIRLSADLLGSLSLKQWQEFKIAGGNPFSYKSYMRRNVFLGLILLHPSDSLQASLPSVVVEDTDVVRNVLSSRFSDGASSKDKKSGLSIWTSGVLKSAEFSNGTRISFDRNRWDGFVGADFNLNGFVLGALSGYGHSFVEGKEGSSNAEMKNIHVGGYSGLNSDRFYLYGGYTVLWSDVKTRRHVDTVALGSEYGIRTDQIFGEFGYRLSFIEPFMNFASVSLEQDKNQESFVSGEQRSRTYDLTEDARHMNAQFLTFGVRAKKELGGRFLGSRVYGMLGFRKGLSDSDAYATRRFSAIGVSFITPGLGISENVGLFGGRLAVQFD